MIKDLYILSKPGIVRGNLVTAAAGFLFAANGNINIEKLLFLLVGVSLIISAAGIINNFIDKNIDAKMTRTKNRPFVTGSVRPKIGLTFAAVIGLIGFSILIFEINTLTFLLGLVGFVDYLAVYGWFKRRSRHATLIGSISGAVPITAGYTAAANNFDQAAMILFLCLVFWQMPHFYAISINRLDEYKSAKIPTLPLAKSINTAIQQINLYICLFIVTATSLYVLGYANVVYLIVMLACSFWWLGKASNGFSAKNKKLWARSMFATSLNVMMIFSVLLSVNSLL